MRKLGTGRLAEEEYATSKFHSHAFGEFHKILRMLRALLAVAKLAKLARSKGTTSKNKYHTDWRPLYHDSLPQGCWHLSWRRQIYSMDFPDLWIKPCPDGVVLEDSMGGLHWDASSLREEEISARQLPSSEIAKRQLLIGNESKQQAVRLAVVHGKCSSGISTKQLLPKKRQYRITAE